MQFESRPFQTKFIGEIIDAWDSGVQNVVGVAPTGAGKTHCFSTILKHYSDPSLAIAHRHELVSQISLAMGRHEIPHRIIGPRELIRDCVEIQCENLGRAYYSANAPTAVAGIDTLIRMNANDSLFKPIRRWVMDEAHHVLRDNKWGKALKMLPNAKGLGVTATPNRADGNGIGRHAKGVFDHMIQTATMREIINMGFLTDYRIVAPPPDLHIENLPVTASGEFSPAALRAETRKSRIVGDIVGAYERFAAGKLGITFAVDIEDAHNICEEYNRHGIPSEVVSSRSTALHRYSSLRKLRNRELLQLVNVDLFGEGFDLPAIEVVSMARPTQSWPLYVQQFGRALRLLPGKEYGLIIDHVQNWKRHGLPDGRINHTLDNREKRSRNVQTIEQTRSCLECLGVYDRSQGLTCPYCGETREPSSRNGPEYVDGVLEELSPEMLAALRGEIDRIHGSIHLPEVALNDPRIARRIMNDREARATAINKLKQTMLLWSARYSDYKQAQRAFYLTFGIDVGAAQILTTRDANDLRERIIRDMGA